ncbi:ComEA family DNA-binding protein [Agaribacter marinus]|uniref:ComEA family DNA-binding protein n=2 Tax=Bacillaceae TaxID=186817 RepID=A0A941DXM7_9BACI|nr:ComEA family DNA-binding protein [Virgibacillus salarius]NAZ10016.1 ComEA family DNA-binding protein [Agaribacter marinus]QRZ20236.1 ComEA family DNA-binding protein [Virgibacillus sp. AGTR]
MIGDKDTGDEDAKIIDTSEPIDPTDTVNSNRTNQVEDTSTVVVDVKGEVNKPGVYELEVEDRVIDAIEVAGGFTKNADESQVNLAQKVQDEMVISVADSESDYSSSLSGTETNEKLRINQASVEEIESLSGIGPAKAEAIVRYREENGPFTTIDDLLNVSGIGEKTIEVFQEEIQIP